MLLTKIKYTSELLESVIKRNNAILIGIYEKLSRDSIITFQCICGEKVEKVFRYMNEHCAKCKKCTNESKNNKRIKTNMQLYGVEHTSQCNIIKDKVKQTMIERYGTEHALQCEALKEKAKQTMKEHYGVEHAFQCELLKAKAMQTIYGKYGVDNISHCPEIKEKIKNNSIEKYGVICPLQNKEVKAKSNQTMLAKYNTIIPIQNAELREKIKQTTMERYGVEHATQSEELREKIKQTCLERYGVEYASQTEEFREKCKKTCLERYGVEYPSQSQEIAEKTQKNAKKYKQFMMPSGRIRKVQGYEPFALADLLKQYAEDDIYTDRKDVPRITYHINGVSKYYFPDIYIKSCNKIIEVKSTWTYQCKKDNIEEKAKATRQNSYQYEIWIYNTKGKRVYE